MEALFGFLLLSVPGWIMILHGILASRRFKRRRQTENVRAEAAFVSYKKVLRKSGMSHTRDTYQPTLRYRAGPREYCVTSPHYHLEEKLHPGDTVVIFYDPGNPARMHMEEENDRDDGGWIRLGIFYIGFAAVLMAAVWLLIHIKR